MNMESEFGVRGKSLDLSCDCHTVSTLLECKYTKEFKGDGEDGTHSLLKMKRFESYKKKFLKAKAIKQLLFLFWTFLTLVEEP